MKKLMIAAAFAATVGGAFAAPQVYDMTITVKASDCKSAGKVYKNVCQEGILLYRAQATQKFYGKFWGCDCDVIACPEVDKYGQPRLDDENSYMFWGAKGAFHSAEMAWDVLQLVGKAGTNIEGAFGLSLYTCDGNGAVSADPVFQLSGAGYGTAAVKGCADKDNYIKSMSGNIVGVYNVGALTVVSGCKYCGETTDCVAWDFCDCVAANSDVATAFGTFTIKYNASQAKKLAKGMYIDQANKFKPFVTKEFECIAKGAAPAPSDPTEDAKKAALKNFAEAKDALAKANDAVVAADKAVTALGSAAGAADDVKGKELAQKKADAANALTAATAAAGTADTQLAAGALSDYATAGADLLAARKDVDAKEANVKAAEAAVEAATTAADVAAAKANLETAKTDLEDAKKALANVEAKIADSTDTAANKAAFDKLAKEQADKAAAEKQADEAAKAASVAEAVWLTGTVTDEGSWLKAKKDAEDAQDAADKAQKEAENNLQLAKIQCLVAGADCK